MKHRLAGRPSIRAFWTAATVLASVAWFGLVATRAADSETLNTGMADPIALLNAYDRSLGGPLSPNIVILSLSNLRGVSSEAVNAGGQIAVDLADRHGGLLRRIAPDLTAHSTSGWSTTSPARADHVRATGRHC